MLLKRLAKTLPPHLALLIPSLEEAHIHTTENIVLTPLSTLRALLRIQDHELDDLISRCLAISAPRTTTADKMLTESRTTGQKGMWALRMDDLFGDWDGVGMVEIAGGKRVGKSLLALHAALKTLVTDEKVRCRWLDTDGSFSPLRAKAILEAWGIADISGILDRLIVSPCFSAEGVFEAVSQIRAEGSDGMVVDAAEDERTSIIVLDSASGLFAHTLLPNTSQATGHATMVNVMNELAEISYDLGLLIIFTNSIYSTEHTKNELSAFSVTTSKPGLGATFTYSSDISLLVQNSGRVFGLTDEGERERLREPGLRGVMEVVKSRVSPSGTWAVYETDGITLADVNPPSREDDRTVRMTAGLPVGTARPLFGALAETVVP